MNRGKYFQVHTDTENRKSFRLLAPGGAGFPRYTAFLLILLFSAACSSKWAPRTEEPSLVYQWPYQPNPAKITYLNSLTGFARGKGAGSVLKDVVTGGGKNERDLFLLPVAVAAGKDGRVAVADMGCKCIHLYLPVEERYLRVSGAAKEKLISPVGVAFDNELNLYVSDSTGRIVVFKRDGTFMKSIRAAGDSALKRPTGIAWNPQKKLLYVADTLENRIYALYQEGGIAFSIGGRGERQGQFNYPTHLFYSASGNLYVTDSLNFRIGIFNESGEYVGGFGHHGDGSGDLAMPKGVAADRDGTVYVVDSLFDNVQLFHPDGEFLLTLGKRGGDFGEFWLPSGIFIDDRGLLYVCDTYNRRIQIFRITENYE